LKLHWPGATSQHLEQSIVATASCTPVYHNDNIIELHANTLRSAAGFYVSDFERVVNGSPFDSHAEPGVLLREAHGAFYRKAVTHRLLHIVVGLEKENRSEVKRHAKRATTSMSDTLGSTTQTDCI
jgi:hypothetical protein